VADATSTVEQPHRNPWACALTGLPHDVAELNGCYMENWAATRTVWNWPTATIRGPNSSKLRHGASADPNPPVGSVGFNAD
jgi:hypothetical protein